MILPSSDHQFTGKNSTSCVISPMFDDRAKTKIDILPEFEVNQLRLEAAVCPNWQLRSTSASPHASALSWRAFDRRPFARKGVSVSNGAAPISHRGHRQVAGLSQRGWRIPDRNRPDNSEAVSRQQPACVRCPPERGDDQFGEI